MMHAQLLDRIQGTRSSDELDAISRALWVEDLGMADDQIQTLAEAIHARRQTLRGQGARKRIIIRRPPQRARDPKASVLRRRQLACSGPMPPTLAAQFTTAELAALKIVADEVRAKGVCSLVLDAIAARAGVSKRSVQNAMRHAAQLGLISITHRRLPGQLKNLPNLVRVIATEWLAWLKVAKLSTPRIEPKTTQQRLHYGQVRQRAGGSRQQSRAYIDQAALDRTIRI